MTKQGGVRKTLPCGTMRHLTCEREGGRQNHQNTVFIIRRWRTLTFDIDILVVGGFGLATGSGGRKEGRKITCMPWQSLMAHAGAPAGATCTNKNQNQNTGVAVPPGVDQVGRGGEVLELGGAHQSVRAWAGCWGGVVDGVDAVEVAGLGCPGVFVPALHVTHR